MFCKEAFIEGFFLRVQFCINNNNNDESLELIFNQFHAFFMRKYSNMRKYCNLFNATFD